MAVTLESVQSASVADSNLVITKPADLAVGDLMIAGIGFSDDSSGSPTNISSLITAPSGWSLDKDEDQETGEAFLVYTKEADSDDVLATNFTWTFTGGDSSYHMVGIIARISEFGLYAGSASNYNSNTSTTVTATGFTPSRENTLFLGFLLNISSSGLISNSSVALATDNPTWVTEETVQYSDSSRASTMTLYSATRSEDTGTGTITGTTAISVPFKFLAVYSLSTKTNGTISPTTYANVYTKFPYKASAELNVTIEDPTPEIGNAPTSWTNETKHSASWTNQDKS